MTTTLELNGRMLLLRPASLGKIFEDECTVTVMEQVPASAETQWRRLRKAKQVPMFWYDKNPKTGEEVYCTYSGYHTMIASTLKERGIPFEEVDIRQCGLPAPDLGAVKGVEWRHRQKEALAIILSYRGGVIKCPMAWGKSFLIRQLAKIYPTAKIVITVASLDIAQRMYEDLLPFLTTDLGFCGTGMQKPNRVTVAVKNSLERCDRDANIVLCDECHTMAAVGSIKLLNRFHRAKMFGFSASPTGRSDGGDKFLNAIFGPVLIDVGYAESVAAGSIVQLEASIYRCQLGPDVSGFTDKYMVDRLGIIRNVDRNNLIIRAVRELEAELGADAQILITCALVEHVYLLQQLLPEYTVVTGVVQPDRLEELKKSGAFIEGQQLCTAKQRREYRGLFETNKLKRVIASSVWNVGCDFRDLAGLVRADGLASGIAANQVPGRLSRLGKETDKKVGRLVDFFDLFSDNLRNRSMARFRSYEKNGWKLSYVD